MKWCRNFSVLLLAFGLHLTVACSSDGEQQQQGFEEQVQQGDEAAYNEQGQAEQGDEAAMADENMEQGENNAEFSQEAGQNGDDMQALENEVENLDNLANNDASQDDLQAILNEVNNNEGADLAQGNNNFFNNNQQATQNSESVENMASANAPTNSQDVADDYVDLNQGSVAPAMVAGNLPEMGTKMAYIVEKGDTLGTIAAKIYGDSKRWKELSQQSSLADPNRIYPGDLVYYQLDQNSQNFASSYENQARSSVTVGAGDTLRSIAKQVYGTTQAWPALWRQNDTIENPEQLTVGMTLYFVQAGIMNAELNKVTKVFAKNAKKLTKLAV